MKFVQKIFSWNRFIWFHEFFLGLDFLKFSGLLLGGGGLLGFFLSVDGPLGKNYLPPPLGPTQINVWLYLYTYYIVNHLSYCNVFGRQVEEAKEMKWRTLFTFLGSLMGFSSSEKVLDKSCKHKKIIFIFGKSTFLLVNLIYTNKLFSSKFQNNYFISKFYGKVVT